MLLRLHWLSCQIL
jgi:hypothetical protein